MSLQDDRYVCYVVYTMGKQLIPDSRIIWNHSESLESLEILGIMRNHLEPTESRNHGISCLPFGILSLQVNLKYEKIGKVSRQ